MADTEGVRSKKWRDAIRSASATHRWQQVMLTVKDMRRSQCKDVVAFNQALNSLGNRARWREAEQVLESMEADGPVPDVCSYNCVLAALGRGGRWRRCLRLLAKMSSPGFPAPDLVSYNTCINAAAKSGRLSAATGLLQEARNCGLSPDVVSYSSAIAAATKVGQWRAAVELLNEMETYGIMPNKYSFSSAVHACVISAAWQPAVDLLDRMRASGLPSSAMPFAFSGAIRACVIAGEARRALSLLQRAKDEGVPIDKHIITATMGAAALVGNDWSLARSLMDSLDEMGIIPDLYCYNAALHAAAAHRDANGALRMLATMIQNGVTPDVVSYNSLINAHCRAGDWRSALGILREEMPVVGVEADRVSYTTVIHGCSQPDGSWEDAFSLLDEMVHLGITPEKAAYDLVMKACGNAGEWGLALQVFHDMASMKLQPDLLSFNMAILACTGQGEVVQALLDEMRRMNINPDGYTLSAVVEAHGGHGEWSNACAMFDAIRHDATDLNSRMAYFSLLNILLRAGQYDQVLLRFDSMREEDIKPDESAFDCAIVAAARLSNVSRCLELADCLWVELGALPSDKASSALLSKVSTSLSMSDALLWIRFVTSRGGELAQDSADALTAWCKDKEDYDTLEAFGLLVDDR
jgi:pentatricopeptide repeat protein